jgi:cell division septum initiation protein DivIVA
MARGRNVEDLATLQMALVGFQMEKQKIDQKIRELQAQLKGKRVVLPSVSGEGRSSGVKRILSPAARKRIADAQKRRWAEHRRRAAQQAKSQAPKAQAAGG